MLTYAPVTAWGLKRPMNDEEQLNPMGLGDGA